MENKVNFENNLIRQKRIKYSQELIDFIWKRLADEGIENADNLIGTMDTIENIDFEKFWSAVTEKDIQDLIFSYEQSRKKQLDNFEKYKERYTEGDFVPEIGEILSRDTLWWDEKIKDLEEILKTL